MNIPEAYKLLTSTHMTGNSRQAIIAELRDYLASQSFSPKEALTDSTRNSRVLSVGLIPITHMAKFQGFADPDLCVLLCHGMLMRLSCHMHESETLIDYIPSVFRLNLPQNIKRVGTLLGYAIGYTVGQGMYLGHDMTGMNQVFSEDRFIAKRERFYQAIIKGYQAQGVSLLHDRVYLAGLKERYDGWSDSHFSLCMDILRDNEDIRTQPWATINRSNERLTWLLNAMCCDNPFFIQLHAEHMAKAASYEDDLQQELENLLGDKETNETELTECLEAPPDVKITLSKSDNMLMQIKKEPEEIKKTLMELEEMAQKMHVEKAKYDMLKDMKTPQETEKNRHPQSEKPVKTNYSQYL